MTVANHYINFRKIPATNVFYLDYPAGRISAPSSQFKKRILEPVLTQIKDRKLTSQIDYIAYSCDFPWKINFADQFSTETLPRQQTPWLSLPAATYLSAFVLADRKEMLGALSNFYCTPVNNLIVVSRGFRSSYRWSLGGRRAGAEGLPYMLSAMLGVNTVPGNTVDEIVWYLKRAAGADGTKPKGTIYYVKNKTIRSTVRDKDFAEAARQVRLAGVNAEVIEGFFPENKQNVAGVTCGRHVVNPAGSHCRFLPGSFFDNLTSAGGQFLPQNKQTCISEFLRMGAAGACGTVVEPLALPPKFPNATLFPHYVHGCSMAESFYQSLAAPFQQILVGDPLCQPWATIPEVSLDGITEGSFVGGTVNITPRVSKIEGGVSTLRFFVDGVFQNECRDGQVFAWDTTKFSDGFHEIRMVATDNTPIETQGRWMAEIAIKNGTEAVQLSVEKDSLEATSDYLIVAVNSTNKAETSVSCNGLELGKVESGNGQISISKAKLGTGPLTLVATSKGSPGLRSRALDIVLPNQK
ncbi:hypothetical protein [Bythopirellula polymerisocia]|nr:hypothetical protein [Bythopirellula polymerisocia]